MIRSACSKAVALIVLALAAPALSQQQYLYSPTQVDSDVSVPSGDGILVREMVIKKGDTLSGISKKTTGRGYYYPQILLFNDIKNPNLIHTGKVLRVPVINDSMKKSAQKKAAGKSASKKLLAKHRGASAERQGSTKLVQKQSQANGNVDLPEKTGPSTLFNQGLKAYQQGDCRSAIERFDRFLAESPSSPLAADASLYKADCYLKFSN